MNAWVPRNSTNGCRHPHCHRFESYLRDGIVEDLWPMCLNSNRAETAKSWHFAHAGFRPSKQSWSNTSCGLLGDDSSMAVRARDKTSRLKIRPLPPVATSAPQLEGYNSWALQRTFRNVSHSPWHKGKSSSNNITRLLFSDMASFNAAEACVFCRWSMIVFWLSFGWIGRSGTLFSTNEM